MDGSPREWREREENFQREQRERDRIFEKTLTLARKQSWIIKTMMSEEEHEEIRDDMRSAYLQHGTGFDPFPIQEGVGPSGSYAAITGTPAPGIENVLMGLENAIDNVTAHLSPQDGQLVGGVHSPPPTTASQRCASDMLGMSPTSSPREWLPTPMGQRPPPTQVRMAPAEDMDLTPAATSQCTPGFSVPPSPRADDMQLTPTATSAPPRTTPVSAHQALLDRARRTLEEASQRLNFTPTSAAHPLSHSFKTQSRQPLGTLYDAATPSTSRAAPAPPRVLLPPEPCVPGPSRGTSPQAQDFDDPRLQFRSRLSPGQQTPSPHPTARAPSPQLGAIPRTPSPRTTRRPASTPPSRPTPQSVQAAAAAGVLRGTQRELEAMGFLGRTDQEVGAEYAFVDQNICPYQGSPPEVVGQGPGGRGLLKEQGAEGGRKKRVMLKRKVTKITIPPRPDRRQVEGAPEGVLEEIPGQVMPYMYTPQDPQYSHREVQLLPPRRLTPSPLGADGHPHYYGVSQDGGSPRSAHQLQIRRDLETDWDRRQEAVPSREQESDHKKAFGRPLPKSFTTGKPKKLPSYRGGARCASPQPTPSTSFGMAMGGSGRPQTPTTRTGLVLRTPSTPPTPGRGGSAGASRGRGGTRGSSRGGRGGGRGGVSPTRSGSPMAEAELQRAIIDVEEKVEQLQLRVLGPLEPVPEPTDDQVSPVERVRQGFIRVRQRLEKLQDLAESKIREKGGDNLC